MPAGLQVHGSHGVLQVDENYRNLCFKSKGNISGSGTVVVNNASFPIVALYPTAGTAIITHVTVSGSTYTFSIEGTTEYFVFDVPPAFPANGVGLQVWDAAGAPAFDSNLPYMKPVDVFDHTVAAPPPSTDTDTGYRKPAGKKYAIAMMDYAWFIHADFPGAGFVTVGTTWYSWFGASGNELWYRRYDVDTQAGSGTTFSNPSKLLMLDVTDL